jgi:hypothetical protein
MYLKFGEMLTNISLNAQGNTFMRTRKELHQELRINLTVNPLLITNRIPKGDREAISRVSPVYVLTRTLSMRA